MESAPVPANALIEAPPRPLGAAPPSAALAQEFAGMRLPPPPHLVSGTWVAVLGWLLPGLGQMATGRLRAGLALLVVIGSLFLGGLALTDFSCIDPHTYRLEFVAQALIGGPTALALRFTEGVRLERLPPWREVGALFVVVSGFLNLIAICSAAGDAVRRNAAARLRHAAALQEVLARARARALAERMVTPTAPDPGAALEHPAPAPWPALEAHLASSAFASSDGAVDTTPADAQIPWPPPELEPSPAPLEPDPAPASRPPPPPDSAQALDPGGPP